MKCLSCENEFEYSPKGLKLYCSKECQIKQTNLNKYVDRKCQQCSELFKASRNYRKIFCSSKCKLDFRISEKRKKLKPQIPSATIGAIGELKVCADLMEKGYFVYRAVSPACPSDLTITCEKKFYRVEVTTGYFNEKGKIMHNKLYEDPERFDIVAVVLKNNDIVYIPELPCILKKKDNENV